MSGPKVIRIVTLEEVLEICAGELARVDAAMAEWQRVAGRNGLDSPSAVREVKNRRAALTHMMSLNQHLAVQKHAPLMVDWIHQDLQQRLDEKITRQNRVAANLESASQSLLKRCQEQGLSLTAQQVADLANDDEKVRSRVVSQVLSLLAQQAESSPRADEIAHRLRGDEPIQSLQDWMAASGYEEEDPRSAAAERQLKYLRALAPPALVASFSDRLEGLKKLQDTSRLTLLLDALALDLAAEVALQKEASGLREEIGAVRAQLGLEGSEDETDLDRLREIRTALVAENQARVSALSAKAAREIVLRGLRDLGYEVQEGMDTVWSEQGKLVVRHSKDVDYGLELGGRAEAGRMQVRAVSFSDNGTAADIQAETTWCGDLSRLQTSLAASGTELAIVKALPVGAQPVKRVVLAVDDEEREEFEELRSRRVGD